MNSHKWELIEDGYHREQRLVEFPSGLIIGGVRGSDFENRGWYAFSEGQKGTNRIGYFVTENMAKKAVESAVSKEVPSE